MLGHSHGNTEVFFSMLQGPLSDEGFKIDTPVGTQVLDSADLLFEWCSWSYNKKISYKLVVL